jgi:hypothetical protein
VLLLVLLLRLLRRMCKMEGSRHQQSYRSAAAAEVPAIRS